MSFPWIQKMFHPERLIIEEPCENDKTVSVRMVDGCWKERKIREAWIEYRCAHEEVKISIWYADGMQSEYEPDEILVGAFGLTTLTKALT